jgi:CRP-like cAMP-binding protein
MSLKINILPYISTNHLEAGFTLILSALERHISLTDDEQKLFISLLQYKKIRKRQFILHEGDICQWSTFVTAGCLRGFTVDKNNDEHVLSFAPEGWWIADMYSLITEKPGQLNIEALEDTEALLLPKKGQEQLYVDVPKFERFFRIITENSLVANQQRLIDNLSLTAEERYLKFCKVYPTLINQLPQKQIASYIGVTPEFFSRMRTLWLRGK